MAAPMDENGGAAAAKPTVKSLASWLKDRLTPEPTSWAARILYAVAISALLAVNAVKIVVKPLFRLFCIPNPPPLIVRTPDTRFNGLNLMGYDFEVSCVTGIAYGRCWIEDVFSCFAQDMVGFAHRIGIKINVCLF